MTAGGDAQAATDLPARVVTLVLCRADGEVLGALEPFEVAVPWWQEVGPVVAVARAHTGIDVTVLRLLEVQPAPRCAGGEVTYLAELRDGSPAPPTRPWPGEPSGDHPLRSSWARPGGPTVHLAWADSALAELGTPRTGPAEQVRAWNLSSLWRLPLDGGAAWLKVVPPFFAHEGAVLARLDRDLVPRLLAADGPRVLLAEVVGEDQWEATGAVLARMADLLVGLQSQWIGRVDELLALGAPDWRAQPLTALLTDLVDRWAPRLRHDTASALGLLVAGLPARFSEIASCGLPDTLVHGDFHRGNVRGSGSSLVLLDWGDSGAGHPMLDQPAFLEALPHPDQAAVRTAWAGSWRRRVPGCDPDRAAALLAPVAALRQALIYQVFLDNIEPAERTYHEGDPPLWLERAAQLV